MKNQQYSLDQGDVISILQGLREFVRPSDILLLDGGKFLVRYELGIQMFTEQGEFTRSLGVGFMNRCYGLTMDGEGRVVTLNSNTGIGGCGKLTALGQTDVFYLDIPTGAVVKRVELEDILGEHQKKSDCRFLTWVKEKLYIVDMGLSRVYCIQEEKVSCILGIIWGS